MVQDPSMLKRRQDGIQTGGVPHQAIFRARGPQRQRLHTRRPASLVLAEMGPGSRPAPSPSVPSCNKLCSCYTACWLGVGCFLPCLGHLQMVSEEH